MSEVRLEKMSEAEYTVWHVNSIRTYADEIARNGMTQKEAAEKADADFKRLLPQGLFSIDQFLFTAKINDEWIGTLWFGVRGASDNRKAFIYDIVLNENIRGKGYGKKIMLLLEEEVKKLGLRHIGLHVFGHNSVARNLYENLGYITTNVHMEKTL